MFHFPQLLWVKHHGCIWILAQMSSNPKVRGLSHVGHVKMNQYGFRAADFLNPYLSLFLQQTEVGKGKMYIQVKLRHCAFYQYNHCYINSYLDEDLAPIIVPTIKGLNRDVGLYGRLEAKQMV